MAIIRNTAAECFDVWRAHISKLVCAIIPTDRQMHYAKSRGSWRKLSFTTQGGSQAVPIQTKHGRIYLYLFQKLDTIQTLEQHQRLRVTQYNYKLYPISPKAADAEAAIRWEYEHKREPRKGECLNHVQFGRIEREAIQLPFGTGSLDLNRIHTATGWVSMEQVFRFLIHELGMQPPCGNDWPGILCESERAFSDDF